MYSETIFNLFSGPDEIEVTSVSQTLEELGIVFHPDVCRITLIPASAGIFWADGEAVAGVNPFPSHGAEIGATKNTISSREFIVASGTIKMQVIQEGGGNSIE